MAALVTERHLSPRQRVELALEIFWSIAEPGREYSQVEIAAATGICRTQILDMEKAALAKMRRAAARQRATTIP